ncbi:cupin domain-containing protein [Tsukamurella strandjordii]|uniref:Cupin domain-containing protein n=1 Tax=Tsukamurella strandjordii TaxID=147577 RepID=A0AA90SHY3_9ACTN|nr:cupin domain-containing protein [Tsukamurella strandjordii]MDP0399399.1 cupin domain-containing protein [Tsukamurella strandjordii]
MIFDADRIATQLGLQPHPEGGRFREYWRSDQTVSRTDGATRSVATAIHFLLGSDDRSQWHTVRSDELWLWQGGGAIDLRLGGSGATPSTSPESVLLGPDIDAGQALTVLVPAGTWQSAQPVDGPVLVSCVVAPGFDFEDFRLLGD